MQRFTPQYPRSYKTKPPSQKAPDRRPLLVPHWERAEMACIYKHRKGWQACANELGERVKKNFATKAAVKKWANATEVGWGKVINPAWAGPSKIKPAGMLVKYAHQFTNSKTGANYELDRINRYFIAEKLPQLRQDAVVPILVAAANLVNALRQNIVIRMAHVTLMATVR